MISYDLAGQIRAEWILGGRSLAYERGDDVIGCGTSWNTFDTKGRCPGCDLHWRYTACIPCGSWALHADWYAPEDE